MKRWLCVAINIYPDECEAYIDEDTLKIFNNKEDADKYDKENGYRMTVIEVEDDILAAVGACLA